MKKQRILTALIIAMAPLAANAASVDLTVSGTVVPTSCVPSFAGGSHVNLGQVEASRLNQERQTDLPPRDLNLIIACDAPAPVEIAVVDNRAETKAPGMLFKNNPSVGLYYGLGSVQGVPIGGFGLSVGQPTTDGTAQTFLVRTPENPVWRVPTSGLVSNSPTSYSWGESAASGPVAARLHAFPMQVLPAIRRASALPETTDSYELSGSVTFNVFYL